MFSINGKGGGTRGQPIIRIEVDQDDDEENHLIEWLNTLVSEIMYLIFLAMSYVLHMAKEAQFIRQQNGLNLQ